jgi:hypothetical protein
VSAAGIHDDAGAFPCFNETLSGIRAVELQNEIIHVGDLFQQISGVGVHFFQERAAVHDLSARHILDFREGIDGGGECGDAGGGVGFGLRGGAEAADVNDALTGAAPAR